MGCCQGKHLLDKVGVGREKTACANVLGVGENVLEDPIEGQGKTLEET